jgi:hypothetical protein
VVAVVRANSQMVALVGSAVAMVVVVITSALVVARHKRLVALQDVPQSTSMETKCAQLQELHFAVVTQTLLARAVEADILVEALVARWFMQDLVAAAAVGQRLMHL